MAAVPATPIYREWRFYRWDPYDIEFAFVGVDWSPITAATFQVRNYPDAPDPALLSIALATPTAEGLSIRTTTTGGIVTSYLRTIVNETTIEALLPFPGNGLEPGQNVNLQGALKLSGPGFKKCAWFAGPATIIPGANKA